MLKVPTWVQANRSNGLASRRHTDQVHRHVGSHPYHGYQPRQRLVLEKPRFFEERSLMRTLGLDSFMQLQVRSEVRR